MLLLWYKKVSSVVLPTGTWQDQMKTRKTKAKWLNISRLPEKKKQLSTLRLEMKQKKGKAQLNSKSGRGGAKKQGLGFLDLDTYNV